MRINEIVREYSKAIMHFAFDDYSDIVSFFSSITNAMKQSRDFSNFLFHPGIPLNDKMDKVLKLSSRPVQPIVEKVIRDLVNHRGIDLIPLILERMEKIYKERVGIQDAFVASAIPLNDVQKKHISEAIERHCGKKADVSFSTDPKLIAGYKVKIDNRIFDNSVQRQMDIAADLLSF